MENLTELKQEFVNGIEFNKEDGIILKDNGDKILDFLEQYCVNCSEKTGLPLRKKYQTSIESGLGESIDFYESDANRIIEKNISFSDDNKYINFEINLEFDYDPSVDFACDFENQDENIFYTNYKYKEGLVSFTVYAFVSLD